MNGERRFEKNVNSAFHPMTGLTEYLNSKGEKRHYNYWFINRLLYGRYQ